MKITIFGCKLAALLSLIVLVACGTQAELVGEEETELETRLLAKVSTELCNSPLPSSTN